MKFLKLFVGFALLIMLFGCGLSRAPRYTEEDFSEITDNLLKVDTVQCNAVQGSKIYVDMSFSNKGNFEWQDGNLMTGKIIKGRMKDKVADTLAAEAGKFLNRRCNAEIVKSKSASDVAIEVEVEDFFFNVEKFDLENGFVPLAGGDINSNIEYMLGLNANVNINDEYKYAFAKGLDCVGDVNAKIKVIYLVLAMNRDVDLTKEFSIEYTDGTPVADSIIVQKQNHSQLGFIPVLVNDWAGKVSVYDTKTLQVDNEFDFSDEDSWSTWSGKITDEVKAKVVEMYTLPKGMGMILIYDLMKDLAVATDYYVAGGQAHE